MFAVPRSSKRPGNDDSPKIIKETRQYIRDFDRVAETTTTARELHDTMMKVTTKKCPLSGHQEK